MIVLFVLIDIVTTLLLLYVGLVIFLTVDRLISTRPIDINYILWNLFRDVGDVYSDIIANIVAYLLYPWITIGQIVVPSTMLTSAWVVLFLISVLVLKLLTSLEHLRQFTLWWFKDIDAHPLRAIAKVAATLIVIGAFALKAMRWGWLML